MRKLSAAHARASKTNGRHQDADADCRRLPWCDHEMMFLNASFSLLHRAVDFIRRAFVPDLLRGWRLSRHPFPRPRPRPRPQSHPCPGGQTHLLSGSMPRI